MIGRILDADRTLSRVVNTVWATLSLDHALPALRLAGTPGAAGLLLLGGLAVFGERSVALAGFVALAIGLSMLERG